MLASVSLVLHITVLARPYLCLINTTITHSFSDFMGSPFVIFLSLDDFPHLDIAIHGVILAINRTEFPVEFK